MKNALKSGFGILSVVFATSTVTAQPLPADEDLADLYEYSCMACHAKPDTGAPQTGDQRAWAPRLEKGEAALLDNTIDGFQSMPALGSCPDCTAEDFAALIKFMSSGESPEQLEE